jgi:cytochrome oxidase Cu insertion factor (SCO1/SenC/PrrC family)
MNATGRRIVGTFVLGAMVAVLSAAAGPAPAAAVEVGELAPDFKLPSTNGVDIGLADFRGKKWVFVEFYGGDFHPT